MDVHDELLPEEQYAEFVANMPEVCVEVVVESGAGVLLAKRTNEPAKGEWFWPGSRLFKGERLDDAVVRIVREELGVEPAAVERLGVAEHFWERSAQGGSRHTVNVVHRATTAAEHPDVELDDQHDDYRWASAADPGVHEHVRGYFERFDLPRGP